MMRPTGSLLLTAFLALGCGGGSIAPSTGGLRYQDPDTPGWRLVRGAQSTSERLELALVGPADARIRGASLTVVLDDRVAEFVPFENGDWLRDASVLVTPRADKPGEAKLVQLRPALRQGNKLSVGLFQKDSKEPAKPANGALFSIALRGRGGVPGQSVALVVRKATVVPEDLSADKPRPQPISVAVGTLTVP